MKTLAPIDSVAFAELLDLCKAERPRSGWKANGSFVRQQRNGNGDYWYFKGYERPRAREALGRQTLTYAGRVGDPEVEAVVAEHAQAHAAFRNRRQLATRLRRAGLPSPRPVEGAMVQVLAKAGLFDKGATVVGSVAFQTYGGLLGVRLEEQWYRTQDLDLAQPAGLIVDSTEAPIDLLEELRDVDPTFAALHHGGEPDLVAGFGNAAGFSVEFLTPLRAHRSGSGRLTRVAGLPGIGAQTLRFLEFVLGNPVQSVLLHDAGILVPVPEPSRYAVHKLIVAASRTAPGAPDANRAKALKDVQQAQSLIEGIAHARMLPDLGRTWLEAWTKGPSWKRTLRDGTLRLEPTHLGTLATGVLEAGALEGLETPFDQANDVRQALLKARG